MNAFQAAVVARLKAASLLDVAERAAKREELKLAHCIEPGEITGGHRALWRALAAAGKTNEQVASLVGRPRSDVDAELVPAAKPTPVPKSGVRARDPHSVKDVAIGGPATAASREALKMSRVMEDKAARAELSFLRGEVHQLRRLIGMLSAKVSSMTLTRDKKSAADIISEAALAHGVTTESVMETGRGAAVVAARKTAARRLSEECGMSAAAIARAMGRDSTTIHYHLKKSRRSA